MLILVIRSTTLWAVVPFSTYNIAHCVFMFKENLTVGIVYILPTVNKIYIVIICENQ